jgi:RNA polymerase-binding transcription factor DksA
MTNEELKKLDEDLAKEEKVLENQLDQIANEDSMGGHTTRVPNYDDDDHDEDAYAHEVTDFDRNSALKRELEARLRDVRKTREKIKSGNYGKCDGCLAEIGSERLKVMPIASLCISCAKNK